MKKHEFLRELENSLKGKLSEIDLREVLSDYNDIFQDGILKGRDEDEISGSIGSPTLIAQTIIDDSKNNGPHSKTTVSPVTSNLAPMSKRFLAYLIDAVAIVFFVIVLAVAVKALIPIISKLVSTNKMASTPRTGKAYLIDTFQYKAMYNRAPGHLFFRIFIIITSLTASVGLALGNIVTAFQLWLFKGYTLGKWITKIKVVKVDNSQITFWDAFLRDFLLKFGAAIISYGILNPVSFILACLTPDHKTIHDSAAKTKVINIKR